MLRKAKARVADLRLKNVEGLAVMDAEKLEFPDNSFDVVMAQYVVTAVPNPEAALDEFARVLRPGGEMILLSRVSADAGMRRFIEQRLQPVVRQLGWRTEFAWSRYAQWLAGARARYGIGRAPPGAAARSLLADPFPQDQRSRLPPECARAGFQRRVVRRAHVIMMSSHAGHRISCNHIPTRFGGENDEEFPRTIANTAVG